MKDLSSPESIVAMHDLHQFVNVTVRVPVVQVSIYYLLKALVKSFHYMSLEGWVGEKMFDIALIKKFFYLSIFEFATEVRAKGSWLVNSTQHKCQCFQNCSAFLSFSGLTMSTRLNASTAVSKNLIFSLYFESLPISIKSKSYWSLRPRVTICPRRKVGLTGLLTLYEPVSPRKNLCPFCLL